MIKSRRLSKLTKCAMALSMLLMIMSVTGMGDALRCKAAGNYQDTLFEYTINTDILEITDVATPVREKWDYTSSYIYNRASTSELRYIRVGGSFGNSSYVDCTYGPAQNCPIGWSRYLPNLVKENGYTHARLLFDPGDGHHGFVSILWSPDSI